MTPQWKPGELDAIAMTAELRIAARRPDGTSMRAVPIWAVVSDGQVYVRTWHRRENGWFGRAVTSGRATISVPGVEAEVDVVDVGPDNSAGAELRAAIDAAYLDKYGRGDASVDRMVGDDAADATLRLDRD